MHDQWDHGINWHVLTCRQKYKSSIARTHPYSTHIHPHSAVGHVIMSITSCLSGTICPLIKPYTMWITVQSPCLAPLHLTSPRVKTPWLKLHWFLFVHLPLFPFFKIPIKGKKLFYCLHVCMCSYRRHFVCMTTAYFHACMNTCANEFRT